MGRHCGFEFYKLIDGKFVDADVIEIDWGRGPKMYNYLNIDGRCDATSIFLDAVISKESPNRHNFFSNEKLKPEEKYSAYLLLNHPELDGFEIHDEKDDPYYSEWFKKYFYIGLNEFKNLFDFEQAQKEHDDLIQKLYKEIDDYSSLNSNVYFMKNTPLLLSRIWGTVQYSAAFCVISCSLMMEQSYV